MAYKVHVKRLSSYQKKLKQARHERRMAKGLLAELPTAEQIEEIGNTTFANLNTHVGLILKTDYPEASALMGADWFETVKRFHDAQMRDTLIAVMGQCEEELWTLFGVSMLSLAAEPEQAT